MVGVTSCTHQKEKLLQKHSKNLGESLLLCFKKIFPLRDLTCLVSKLRTLNYCVIWLQSVNTLGSVKKTNSYLMFIISGYRNIAGSLYMTFGFARTAAAPVLLGTTQHNVFSTPAQGRSCVFFVNTSVYSIAIIVPSTEMESSVFLDAVRVTMLQ